MCQSHVDARFPMERSASTKIRNPSVTLHKQACTMLSKWSVIWVGNTFPQGDAGLLRLLAVRNDLGPAPSRSLYRFKLMKDSSCNVVKSSGSVQSEIEIAPHASEQVA